MDGLGQAVGNGVTSLVSTAFDTIGGTVNYIVNTASSFLPGIWGPVVLFVALAGTAWFLAKR
jgi:phage-related protein